MMYAPLDWPFTPANVSPPWRFVFVPKADVPVGTIEEMGFRTLGLNAPFILLWRSVSGVVKSQRRPRFTVSFLVIFQSSWTHGAK